MSESNEEKFAKSVRTPYIITYSIFIPFGLLLAVGGIFLYLKVAVEETQVMFLTLCFLGAFLACASVGWLIYFIKMPEYSITYKDGKLNFRNKLECTPAQLEKIENRVWGLDSVVFGYGRVIVYVGGKKYRFNFIYGAQEVVKKLYMIKDMYAIAQNAAYRNSQAAAEEVVAATEMAEPNTTTDTEENDG